MRGAMEAAAGGVEPERALTGTPQPALDVGGVAHEERRGVDEHAAPSVASTGSAASTDVANESRTFSTCAGVPPTAR